MRSHLAVAALLACSSPSKPVVPPPTVAPSPPVAVTPAVPVAPPGEVMTADTPRTTATASFVAPAGWMVSVRGNATVLEPPETGSYLAILDVPAKDADTAIASAWASFDPKMKWKVHLAAPQPDRDGWTGQKQIIYEVPPNEKRDVAVFAAHADVPAAPWTIVLYNMTTAVGEKRGSQVEVVVSRLLPKDYKRESFAGKPANKLDAQRLAVLTKFVDDSRDLFGIPGIALGIVQDGKVVFADGFGVRELGKKAKPDGDTLFEIASNTKALTTLLLAKLVDEKKLTWDTPVTDLMPTFKLGDAATTKSVLVKHLVCACTGLPRQDMEWLFESKGATPATNLALLGTMQPTSKFGELFQYSNLMAAAGGFVAAFVLAPKQELGKAYDAAMQARVFGPLGMTATTFDFAKAQHGNHAGAFGLDIDGKPAPAVKEVNDSVVPARPAGGAWSNIRDMLKYVQMEIARGKLPSGKVYIGEEALLARRTPQVAISKDATYGMGLVVDTTWGIPVVHHGGDLVGYHSDMIWLPDHNVGAVILTNSDGGGAVRNAFRRKLLEVLFDGESRADAEVKNAAETLHADIAASRARIVVPPDPAEVGKLAPHYTSDALGEVTVKKDKDATVFDVGEWKSAVASRKNDDGTISFVTIGPGVGIEFLVGSKDGKRTLVLRDAQHEYTFIEN